MINARQFRQYAVRCIIRKPYDFVYRHPHWFNCSSFESCKFLCLFKPVWLLQYTSHKFQTHELHCCWENLYSLIVFLISIGNALTLNWYYNEYSNYNWYNCFTCSRMIGIFVLKISVSVSYRWTTIWIEIELNTNIIKCMPNVSF